MLHKIIGSVGFVLLVLGAGGIESDSMAIPAGMVIAGLAICGYRAFVEYVLNKNRR